MSYWDSETQKVIRFKPRECSDYPGWLEVDCGCCGGIMWGGDYPVECDRCASGGTLFLHQESGVLAQWPGGPLLGRLPKQCKQDGLYKW